MKRKKAYSFHLFLVLAISSFFLEGCTGDYVPKPRGFHRIAISAPVYVSIAGNRVSRLPYQFEINQIAQLAMDSSKYTEDNWTDLRYPDFDAEVELTYKPLSSNEELTKLIRDARMLVAKHQVKATAIDEQKTIAGTGDIAYLFELQGQVPSQLQFYVTDSSQHFLRGALYFKTASKNDSLSPVIRYIAKDIHHLISTLSWQSGGKPIKK